MKPATPVPTRSYSDGHWPTFLVSAFNLFFERFLHYGFRSLLVFILLDQVSETQSLAIYAGYGALVFFAALAMGLLGDLFLERRYSTAVGAGLTGIGYLVLHLTMSWDIGGPILGLGIAAAGSGLFRTANFSLFLSSFPFPQRQFVPTYLFYVLVNAGAFLAPLIIGTFFFDFGLGWAPLACGILALLWGGGLILLNVLRKLPPEPPEHRSSLSKISFAPLLGYLLVGLAVVGMMGLGYGMVHVDQSIFLGLMQVTFAVLGVGLLVVALLLGRASVTSILTLLGVSAALLLFWTSFERVFVHFIPGDGSGLPLGLEFSSLNVGITTCGSLLFGAVGIAIPLKGRWAAVLPGVLAVVGWLLAVGLLLLLITPDKGTNGIDSGMRVIVLALISTAEFLLVPAAYLWLFRTFPRQFMAAGLGLAFSISFWTAPLGTVIGGKAEMGQFYQEATHFIPWMAGIWLLLLALVVLWGVFPDKSKP